MLHIIASARPFLLTLAIILIGSVAIAQTELAPADFQLLDVDCQGPYGSGTSFWVGQGVGGHLNARAWLYFSLDDFPDTNSAVALLLSNDPIPSSADVLLYVSSSTTSTYELPYDQEFVYWGRHEADGTNADDGYPTSALDITEAIQQLDMSGSGYLVIRLSAPVCSSVEGLFRGPATENPDDRPRLYFDSSVPTASKSLSAVKRPFR